MSHSIETIYSYAHMRISKINISMGKEYDIMKWIEVSISTTSKGVEFVEAVLLMSGITGWQVFDIEEMEEHLANNPKEWDCLDEHVFDDYPQAVTLMFFVSDDQVGNELIDEIKSSIGNMAFEQKDVDLGSLQVSLSTVDDDNWLESWKEFFVPFAIGEKLVIKPPWESYEDNEKIIVDINPGHLFGTGHHETTRMSIEALERHLKPGHKMLDLGSGSGILSVVGIMLGAENSHAADNSPGAIGVTELNAQANGIEDGKIKVYVGDVVKDTHIRQELYVHQYDLIVANIITDVIIELSPILYQMGTLKPGGVYISSGIIDDRLDEVFHAIQNAGFTVIETILDGGWVSFVAQ
ncbi:MAG: 50S ribosomal protein L11 methyltransferase [Oscillospiraceae bacterium]|nr:50S ribosomal protein L11 methyltransferase [Oscillospiraceae bacterium]